MTSKLADPQNEHALMHLAITDHRAYLALGVSLEDFTDEFARLGIRVAEQVFAEHGQLGPTEAGLRVFNHCRDHERVPRDRLDALFALCMDPPMGVLPDAGKLKRHSRLRELSSALRLALHAAERGDDGVAMSLLEKGREQASRRLAEDVAMQSGRALAESWQEELRRLDANDGISPGLPMLKSAIGQLSAGMVVVVGGSTGVGKSSLALEMVLAAPREGTKTGLISMEDTRFTTTTRILSGLSGVSARALTRGQEPERAQAALRELEELEGAFWLAECIGGNEQDVCAFMSRMALDGVRLVVVDYIGEVEASQRQQDRRNEIRWLMKRLKTHALRLGIALVIVSQLSRPQNHDTARKPSKHDLKEAGDLENSAEFVVLLWRDEEHDFAPVHVELAKSKIGGTGKTWDMQREVYTEDRYGNRRPGNARLREVVKDYSGPDSQGYPLLVTDYVARLANLIAR